MNETDFLTKSRPHEYEVRVRVQGEIHTTIKAESVEDAKAKAHEMIQDDEFCLDLHEVTDAEVDHVWKSPDMFLVTREGRAMQVSRLQDGDIPRQPNERGF